MYYTHIMIRIFVKLYPYTKLVSWSGWFAIYTYPFSYDSKGLAEMCWYKTLIFRVLHCCKKNCLYGFPQKWFFYLTFNGNGLYYDCIKNNKFVGSGNRKDFYHFLSRDFCPLLSKSTHHNITALRRREIICLRSFNRKPNG